MSANRTSAGNEYYYIDQSRPVPIWRVLLDILLVLLTVGLGAALVMAYLSTGSLLEFDSLDALRQLLVDHGWTWLTAVCTMLFSLMHWPCSTTCLTIGKETKSAKWTLLSIAIPTGIGMAVCFLVASAARLLGLA